MSKVRVGSTRVLAYFTIDGRYLRTRILRPNARGKIALHSSHQFKCGPTKRNEQVCYDITVVTEETRHICVDEISKMIKEATTAVLYTPWMPVAGSNKGLLPPKEEEVADEAWNQRRQ